MTVEEATQISEPEAVEPEAQGREGFRGLGLDLVQRFEALRDTHRGLSGPAAMLDDYSLIPAYIDSSVPEEDRVIAAAKFHEVVSKAAEEEWPIARFFRRLLDVMAPYSWGPRLTLEIIHHFQRPRREPIFHNAILTSAVGAFDVHISDLMKAFYAVVPESMYRVDKQKPEEFSLQEIRELGDIESVVQRAIERRVTSLMFKSMPEIARTVKKDHGIDIRDAFQSWTFFLEVIERRHCIVHNGAKASRKYLEQSRTGEVELGQPINASDRYVEDVLDQLEIAGVMLSVLFGEKLREPAELINRFLERTAYEGLEKGRWDYSLFLFSRLRERIADPEGLLRTQVNEFVARKGIAGVGSIRAEVEAWDLSGAADVFVFARHCLLDDLDAAFDLLRPLVLQGKVGDDDIVNWPLIEPMRRDPRFGEFHESIKRYLNEES